MAIRNSPSKARKSTTEVAEQAIKVKYISSPVMIRARDASEFRTIVQEFTGKNSGKRNTRAPATYYDRDYCGQRALKGRDDTHRSRLCSNTSSPSLGYQLQQLGDDFTWEELFKGLSGYQFPC